MNETNGVGGIHPIELALRIHEENHRVLRLALEAAGGNLDVLLNKPFADVLRSLAQNGIALCATND